MRGFRLTSAIIVAGIGMTIASSAVGAPRLVIPETEYNFGAVPQNAKVSHVFWLYSKGDDTLQILKVIPGCGCTQAPLEKTTLAPGDSTRLEVIFDTKHYTGKISKRPRVESNEGPPEKYVQFNCEVMIRADSTYPLIVKPYKLDISQFGQQVRDRMKFTVTNASAEPLDITLVSAPDILTVDCPKTVGAGATVQGSIVLAERALKTEFEKSITIEVNNAAHSRFTIPVKRALRLPGDTTANVNVSASGKVGGH